MPSRKPTGLLVLYDEGKGLKKPEVKLFNPSAQIERQVNAWIEKEPGISVHRIDWLPSGGMLGASVTYSRGERATEALRIIVPGLEGLEKSLRQRKPLESLARFLLMLGVGLGLLGMTLFVLFYPETWYGLEGKVIEDPDTAVKWTVLSTGLGFFLIFAGVVAMLRARPQ